MKTARATPYPSYLLACPYCGADLYENSGNGGAVWQPSQEVYRATVTCEECEKVSKLPAKLLRKEQK